MKNVNIALKTEAILGEGPLWNNQAKKLYWLDCANQMIHAFDPKTNENTTLKLSQIITGLARCTSGRFIGTFLDGIAFIDPITGELEHIVNPCDGADIVLNDAICDAKGRFWTGAMATDWKSPIGKLFCLDSDLNIKTIDEGIILSNGLGFSPDGKTLYFNDFGRQVVFAYDFDVEAGSAQNRRVFTKIEKGHPDGMTVDSKGCVWVALWDGHAVQKFSPNGGLLQTIEMPVPRPTSLMFGGESLSTLYITSARYELSDEQLEKYPLSGSLFSLETGVEGLLEHSFKDDTP